MGFIYNNVGEIIRARDLIDVPDFFFFDQILVRILYRICKGTEMRVRDLIDVPDFSCFFLSDCNKGSIEDM